MNYTVTAGIAIVLGLIELFCGRVLFWLFVGIGGFVVGWFLLPTLLPSVTGWLRMLAGVALGLVCALLAFVLIRAMVAVAGFFIFGGAAIVVARHLGAKLVTGSAGYWTTYVIVGIIGAVLLAAVLDWALVVLTSLAGAGSVAGGVFYFLHGPRWSEWLLLVLLAALGLIYQGKRLTTSTPLTGARRRRVVPTPR